MDKNLCGFFGLRQYNSILSSIDFLQIEGMYQISVQLLQDQNPPFQGNSGKSGSGQTSSWMCQISV